MKSAPQIWVVNNTEWAIRCSGFTEADQGSGERGAPPHPTQPHPIPWVTFHADVLNCQVYTRRIS
jgi:hypothetical protein